MKDKTWLPEIGDTVYFLDLNKVKEGVVQGIVKEQDINVGDKKAKREWNTFFIGLGIIPNGFISNWEKKTKTTHLIHDLFPTKESLIESL